MGGNSESLEGCPEPVNEPQDSARTNWTSIAGSIAGGGEAQRHLEALGEAMLSAGAIQVFFLTRVGTESSGEENAGEWTARAALGVEDIADRPRAFAYARRLAGWVSRTGKPVAVFRVSDDPRFPEPPPGVASAQAVPVRSGTVLDATLVLFFPAERAESPGLLPGVTALAGWVLERELMRERESRLLRERDQGEREILRLRRLAAAGDMAEEMNRELSSPLVGMARLASEVADSLEEADTRRALLETIVEEAARLTRVLTDHREMARSPEPEPQMEDLNRLAAESLGLIKQDFQGKHVTVTERFGADLPPLLLDPNLMRRVLLNILRAALESAAPGGRVKVETKRRGDRVEILVAADGERRPGQAIERLWDPFQGEAGESGNLSPVSIQRMLRDHRGVVRTASTSDWPLVYTLVLPINGNQERRRASGDRRRA